MLQSRTGIPSITAVFLALLVSACAGTPVDRTDINNRFPVGDAEEVFAAGLSSIADKYIDDASTETLALEGIRGLNALDPNLLVSRNDDEVVLRYRRRVVKRLEAPSPDDFDAWAFIMASMTAETQAYSSELASASPEQLYEAIFDGALGSLDVYSRYAGKLEATNNRAKRDGFGGIGVRFRLMGERVVVTEVMPETPASKAGILIDDELTAVQGASLYGLGTKVVVEKLRGPVGTSVDLSLTRVGVGLLEVSVKRGHIVPPTVTANIRNNVLYMKISSFNQGTASSVISTLRDKLTADPATTEPQEIIKGIVLDLRANPGGLLKQSIEVADAFLVHGDILNTQGRHPDSIQHYEAAGQDQALGLPMVVLIDGKSASAAEIVAAALQDRERAVVVGTASYGKGTVQTVIRLPNSGEVTLTWSRFMAPSGYALNGLGVFPVICTSRSVVENLAAALEAHEKTLDTLEVWRSTDHTDIETRRDLRAQCPPERRTGNADIKIAQTLLEDGALYFRALDTSASTAHAVE